MLDFITWTADPVWFHIGPLAIRWYSLAFMVGFLVGYEIESRIYRHEGAPEKWLGILLMWPAPSSARVWATCFSTNGTCISKIP